MENEQSSTDDRNARKSYTSKMILEGALSFANFFQADRSTKKEIKLLCEYFAKDHG